jgi:hypothetical protein
MGPDEVVSLIEEAFGEEGLGVWRVEALFSVGFAEALGEGNEQAARALLRAARLYESHDDPRRAALLAQKIQEAFPDSQPLVTPARNLYSRVTASLGEEPALKGMNGME